jgi:tetratricopeptide (TPR) repeat protein
MGEAVNHAVVQEHRAVLHDRSEFETAVAAHLRHYTRLLDRHAAFLTGDEQEHGKRQLHAFILLSNEVDNIVEALDSAANRHELDWLMMLGGGMLQVFSVSNKNTLLLQMAERVLSVAQSAGSVQLRSVGQVMKLRALREMGRHSELLSLAPELLQEPGLLSSEQQVAVLINLGIAQTASGMLEAAQATLQQGHELARQQQLRNPQLQCRMQLGITAMHSGRLSEAAELLTDCAEGFKAQGDLLGQAAASNNLALVQLRLRQFEAARDNLQTSRQLRQQLGDRRAEGVILANLGSMLGELGEHNAARSAMQEAVTIMRETGSDYAAACITGNLGMLDMATGQHDLAGQRLTEALHSHQRRQHHAAVAETMRFLALNELLSQNYTQCKVWLRAWLACDGLAAMRRETAAGSAVAAGLLQREGRGADARLLVEMLAAMDATEPLGLENDLLSLLQDFGDLFSSSRHATSGGAGSSQTTGADPAQVLLLVKELIEEPVMKLMTASG